MEENTLDFLLRTNDLQKTNRYGNYPDFSETTSEHTFKVILLIDYFYNKFNLDLNYERCIEIAIYHDFGEMDLSKDVDIKENEDKLIKQNKDIYENMKIKQLSEKYYSKIYDYYNEYKNKKTQKSLLVNACDKLEGMIHPISIGEPIMNHELFATYADNAIKSYPILMPIYKQVKNRLKNSYEKWGFEWKKEYDNIFEEC